MAALNRVFLIGRCARDPEIKYTTKGIAVVDLGLAVSRIWSDEAGEKREETSFFEISLFGRQAEVAGQYLKKGSPAFVEARLQTDSWEDKQSGEKRSRLRLVAERLQLLGSRPPSAATPSATPRPAPRPAPAPPAASPRPGVPEPDLDELDPFA